MLVFGYFTSDKSVSDIGLGGIPFVTEDPPSTYKGVPLPLLHRAVVGCMSTLLVIEVGKFFHQSSADKHGVEFLPCALVKVFPFKGCFIKV